MRVVFMGTPDFAVPSLRHLARHHEVSLVLTRPDAVRGRGSRPVPSPVKEAALELGLDVLETRRVSGEALELVARQRPDVICVAAFGAILSDEVLAIAPHGCINVHASLLPHGRGAAPIQRAVLEGDECAGVSIMRIVHDLDAGPYCRQASVLVEDKDCAQLMLEIAEVGARELLCALDEIESGSVMWTEQDESLVTYAAKVEKSEMLLDPADDAQLNCCRVQASTDAAPARLVVANKGLRVLRATLADESLREGEVLLRRGRVVLGCAIGSFEPIRVKPDGRKEMDARAWASGLRGEGLSWRRA